MSKILIIRFSALGDVAMTIPVIYSLAVNFPMHEITVLSRQSFEPLFHELPENVHFISADLNGKHQGIKGLNILYKELKAEKYNYVADFHSVLRSHYLRSRFMLSGVKTASIDKGRKEKKELTQKKNKKFVQLKSGFTRYYEVLEKLGFRFELHFESVFDNNQVDLPQIIAETGEKNDVKWLGIAPFAKHQGKIYPLELQEKVIAHFAKDKRVKVFVFGGGESEKNIINSWIEKYSSITSMVGKLTMSQELLLMNHLDVMFSMDSANMHLASLVNTPVVSLWGATHPYAGFMGWNQSIQNAIQVDLFCRPCSIYGQIPCYRKDYACLYQISPEQIINHIESILF
ncbi:MAG: glycosyltransferase family 9 protein [Paludibacter sp.]|nr:glycosyltransferase family 9 protein [Paludibacter sp.]